MSKNVAWIFTMLIIIYLIGFGIDMMDVDAAQYASMSREMLERKSYLQLYDLGKDYLDKPPFLFWISALSMKIFGVNNFGYRLPSFLFSLLAVYSTYKLAMLFYNRSIALFSALILASCQGFFLMNNDVRTDTILMGWVIFSLWQLAAWYNNNKFYHSILGCIGIAGGMMTKGPIALLVPVFAFGSNFILHRNFKVFLRWQYLIGIIIICILLVPMCIGLYRQFDMHPEKTVNFRTAVSGIGFFFWTQSFGRITGQSYWNNHSNIFTLIQNMLWSFLPWILFFFIALFSDIMNILRQRFRLLDEQEVITTGGFVITYISLGLSKYQLPHYIFVVFPLAAIITAKFLNRLVFEKKQSRIYKILLNLHFILFSLLWIALLALLYICFDSIPKYIPVCATILFILFLLWFFYKKNTASALPLLCLFTIMGINLFLNSSFYPALMRYQMGNVAGRWLHDQKIPATSIFIYKYHELGSFHFYAHAIIPHKDSLELIRPGDLIVTGKDKLQDFDNAGIKYDTAYSNSGFPVSRLSLKFLNPKTRDKQLSAYAIIKIK